MDKKEFRYDINGLRAIAVIGVVIYHFYPKLLPGGFAGVDVFFVISGFLMTKIITESISKNNFNLFSFYMARVNRIVPALAVLCLILLIYGCFYINAKDYSTLAKHIASSIMFLSNITYYQESGYFDSSSLDKWLLHTWSLSVEWQFYILYPVILIFLNYIGKNILKPFLVLVALSSLLFCIVMNNYDPTAVYYLLPFRAWEMLVGGMAILFFKSSYKPRYSKLLSGFGIVLIASSYVLFDSSFAWPSQYSILPVFGTFLVIASNQANIVVLKNSITNKIGFWSYSIYLWHWPLVVFVNLYEIDKSYKLAAILVSLILGFLSYKYVEGIKYVKVRIDNLYKSIPIVSIFLVLISSTLIYYSKGFPHRLEKLVSTNINKKYAEIYPNNVVKIKYDECQLHDAQGLYYKGCEKLKIKQENVKAIILGDSHAGALASGIQYSLNESGKRGILINARASGCLPISGIEHRPGSIYHGCSGYNQNNFKYLAKNYPTTPIIIAVRFNIYTDGFNEKGEVESPFIRFKERVSIDNKNLRDNIYSRIKNRFCNLAKHRDVYIVKPIPEFAYDVHRRIVSDEMLYRKTKQRYLSKKSYQKRNKNINKLLGNLSEECGIHLLDIDKVLLKENGYISNINGIPIYQDSNHLNIYGSVNMSKIYDDIW